MIELKDVSFSYWGRLAVDGITLTVKKGEMIALMGPNASGKSTLAKLINGLLLPDKGQCLIDGVNTLDDPDNARRKAGMVFQDPEDSLVSKKVGDDVAFGPRNLGLSRIEAEVRAMEALRTVGMENQASKGFYELSGGQRQLAAIAGALAMKPSYLVLDEPSSLLDAEGARLVKETLSSLRNSGIGIVLITHDTSEAMLADRVAIIENGRLETVGTPNEVLWCSCPPFIDAPDVARFLNELRELGQPVDISPATVEEAVSRICR